MDVVDLIHLLLQEDRLDKVGIDDGKGGWLPIAGVEMRRFPRPGWEGMPPGLMGSETVVIIKV